ncbi:MAG: ABC transporter substrate-binding protein, partial [Oscillospiraceae bacterium]|nr:ABC transporter substrate-binding protein [Oscillospiraceae bacterium]
MKKIIVFLLLAMLFLFASCGDDREVLRVYNWGDYIAPGVIDRFEEESGIRVIYEMFETNEDMYTKIKNSNSSYDVIIPSDYMIERMIDEDMLAEIDFANITNYGEIDEAYKNLSFDPENKYSVPYTWGTVGILYNKTMVDGPIDSWEALWDPKYEQNIIMMNSQRDAIGMALKSLGYSLNELDPKALEAAKNKLLEQTPLVLTWVVDEVKDKMIGGEAALALVYAGDAVYCKGFNEDLEYVIPKEGSNIFFDSMCIPKNCRNKLAAEKFINFMCSPEIAAENAEYIGYSSPSSSARALMGEAGQDPTAYPDTTKYNLEIFSSLGDKTKIYDELWTEI